MDDEGRPQHLSTGRALGDGCFPLGGDEYHLSTCLLLARHCAQL